MSSASSRVALHQLAAPSRTAIRRRIIGVVVCGMVAAIVGLAAVAWASVALWLWLAIHLGAALGALVAAAALVIVALILGFAALRITRPARAATLSNVLSSKELASAVENHLPQLLIAAAIGGLLFGMRRRK